MRDEKHAAIYQYLSERFLDCVIEQKYDFDRDAQTYKIHFEEDTLLLKVGRLFTDDNDTPEILRLFGLFGVVEALKDEKKLGILVTSDGVRRFGRG